MSHSKFICHTCVRDGYLGREILTSGNIDTCIICCDDKTQCWSFVQLANCIQGVFDRYYAVTSSQPGVLQQTLMQDPDSNYQWDRDGESVDEIVELLTGLPENICIELISLWEDDSAWKFRYQDREDPYGDDARYERIGSSTDESEKRWRVIQYELLHRSRFFSRKTQEFLDDLFSDVHSLRCADGRVVEIYNPDSFAGVFRARTAFSTAEVDKIFAALPEQLGALRGRSAQAGRMNSAGVTVMYGALDKATCIAEVRAPVGSHVVIGKFDLLRPIRVLNLKRLESCFHHVSLFDPEHDEKSDRLEFLRSLSSRLSSPVFSQNAHFDYLTTQCIAEYIAAIEPKIDGVVFPSSQAGGESMNLVLFDDACHIASFGYKPGTKSEIFYLGEENDESKPDPYLVFQSPTPEEELRAINKQADDAQMEKIDRILTGSEREFPEPTLSLDLKSLTIHEVTAVSYSYKTTTLGLALPKAQ